MENVSKSGISAVKMLKSSPRKKKDKVSIVTEIDCQNRVKRLIFSQSINKKKSEVIHEFRTKLLIKELEK